VDVRHSWHENSFIAGFLRGLRDDIQNPFGEPAKFFDGA
jgi:hypothetical protein